MQCLGALKWDKKPTNQTSHALVHTHSTQSNLPRRFTACSQSDVV